LYAVLMLHPRTRTLVFLNSISAVRRITPLLQNLNLPAQALHSNMEQKARLRAIEKFSADESSILISTDVAARGLDIRGVQLIIHYHLPRTAEMYVHRSGRTARGDSEGSSIILCSPEEIGGVKRLVGRVHHESTASNRQQPIRVIDIDRRVVARLKPRIVLAKQIADVGIAKVKGRSDDQFFRDAAEELGVEYDSEEMETLGSGKRGRGNARKQKQREDREVDKGQVAAWKLELKGLLGQRVNVGVSERYIAQGIVDVDALLRGQSGEFLGSANGIDLMAE
jgi:ATP-dependent RNA helicase DDX24/MAK5